MFEQRSIAKTAEELRTDVKRGLEPEEADRRLAAYGRNEMKSGRKKTLAESFLEQLCDPLIYVLLAAAAVSILLDELSDAIIIAVVDAEIASQIGNTTEKGDVSIIL